jgi:hypothetical protein
MTDLFDKYKPLLERMQAVEQAGSRIGPVNEKIVSPTRAIIDGRDTILAGTNNYMGVSPSSVSASRQGKTRLPSSALARRVRALPMAAMPFTRSLRTNLPTSWA